MITVNEAMRVLGMTESEMIEVVKMGRVKLYRRNKELFADAKDIQALLS